MSTTRNHLRGVSVGEIPGPLPFEATAEVKPVLVAGHPVTLRRYVNPDGCEVWAMSPPNDTPKRAPAPGMIPRHWDAH